MRRLPFLFVALLFLAGLESAAGPRTVDSLLKRGKKTDDSDWTLSADMETLIGAMQTNNNGQAAAALGLLGDPRAVDPLLKEAATDDDYEWTVNPALQSLGQLGDPRAVPVLASRLDRGKNNPVTLDRLRVAADALAALGEPGLEALLQRLNGTRNEVRIAVASALGKQQNKRVVPPLLSVLDQVSSAAVSLGRLRDARAVEPLIRHLNAQADKSRPLAVITALGEIGDERAVPALAKRASKDSDPDVRLAAVIALSRINSAATAAPLFDALQDESPVLRRYAAIGLSNGDARAVDPLKKALTDEDASVRCRAAASLLKLRARLGNDMASSLDTDHLQRLVRQRPLIAIGEFTDRDAWKFKRHELAIPDHLRESLAKHLMASGYEVDLVPSGFQPDATMTGAINTYFRGYVPLSFDRVEAAVVRIITLGLVTAHPRMSQTGRMRVAMDISLGGKTYRRIYTTSGQNETLSGLAKACVDAIARDVAR